MNYEKDIKIDETALDVEWIDQPSLMLQYTKMAAEARLEMDEAKEALEFLKAELDKKIRDNPEDYDLGKITETVVQNTILLQPEYQSAIKELNELKFEYEVARGAVAAFDQKKTALENLVKLHGQQYFAGPSIPRDISKEYLDKQKQKQANAGVAQRMKRKKK